ncbi:MAG: LuxR C-terminal-related transcriptional regulator [Synechococcales bacterium]|nr:LuxR C-terminal-related transcriptional regulator [Synechococcales bacterium]
MKTPDFEPHRFNLFKAVLESLIDGVMVVSPQREVLQINSRARQICRQMRRQAQPQEASNVTELAVLKHVPDEIWRVCHALIESDAFYPEQRLTLEHDISLPTGETLRIRAQWIRLEDYAGGDRCLLISLEERNQSIQNIVQTDISKYQLTPREGDVWKLRLRGRSYREIAESLYITENTVKKHVKNILSKRRAVLGDAAG